MKRRMIGLLFLMTCGGIDTWAQAIKYPYVWNYEPREFQASSTNYATVQDGRGLMYFGNYRGLLEYDGAHWRLIPVDNRSMVRTLAVDSAGQVYLGASGEFGRLVINAQGQTEYQALSTTLPAEERFSGLVRVIGTEQGAWFQVFETQKLYRLQGDSLARYDLSEMGRNVLIHYLEEELYLSPQKQGLLRWDGQAFEPVPGGESLRGMMPVATARRATERYLLRAYGNGFYQLDLRSDSVKLSPWQTEIDKQLRQGIFSDMLRLFDGNLLITTFKQGVYLLDQQGALIQHYDQSSGLQDDIVLGAFQDREHSLWLALSRGISRVEITSPLSHYGRAAGLNGIVYAVDRYQGEMYAATPLGGFVLREGHFRLLPGLAEEVFQFFQIPDPAGGAPHLLAATVRGLFKLTDDRPLPLLKDDIFDAVVSVPGHPELVYTLSGTLGLRLFRVEGNHWTPVSLPAGLIGSYKHIVALANGEIWLYADQGDRKGLWRILPSETGAPGEEDWHAVDLDARMHPVEGIYDIHGRVSVQTSQDFWRYDHQVGLLAYDSALSEAMTPQAGGVAYLVGGQDGEIWAKRFRGGQQWLELLRPQGKGYERDSLIFNALSGLEIWGKVYPEANGRAWVGTPEGLYAYDLTFQRPGIDLPTPLIRQVKVVGGETIYAQSGAEPILLSYQQNSLIFQYVVPFFDKEYGTRYRYRLQGQADEWSPWTKDLKKEYTLLPPGEYVFEVQAHNAFHEQSSSTQFAFVITPPWYRTYWAFIGYGILAIFLIYLTVKLNTHRLRLKNEQLERMVFERTNEIWEQHKEIVKKTVALKQQKEEVAHQRNLLEEKNTELARAIERLKATQSQLVESEKMASLGQLTAGIAHEINNPINYVKNNVAPLKRDFEEIRSLFLRIKALEEQKADLPEVVAQIQQYAAEIEADYLFEEMEQLLHGIEEGAVRTKEIVDGLKTFSRSDRDAFKLVDIHAGIESTLTLLNNRLKDRIEVQRDFAEIPVVECLPGKLNQVFMNVFSNAIQAIESKARHHTHADGWQGRIALQTQMRQGCLPGHRDCIQIIVQDNGCGIEPGVKPHIFEPFFTTKDVGEGTGLGLAISFGIVEQHQGRIEVASQPGQGATFTITLPFRQQEQEAMGG